MNKDNTLQQLEYFVKTYGNEVCGLIPIQVIKNAVRDIRIEKERGDDLYRELMDLIAENTRLTEDANIWQDRFKEQVEETDELKAEIERLTEEGEARESDLKIAWVDMEDSRQKYHKCYREKEELQKQVDELKARDMSEMRDLFNNETDRLIEKAHQQGVKDTVEEMYDFIHALLCRNIKHIDTVGFKSIFDEMLEYLKNKGVEVE